EKLQKKGLLVKTDPSYVHRKAVSQRGGGTIEPQIKLQWFIDVNKPAIQWNPELCKADSSASKTSLRAVMQSVVHHGNIKIVPERFSKTYFHWVDNLRDWCISRQIWWGHRVPVWYCGSCEPGYAQRVNPGDEVPDIRESIKDHAMNAVDTQSGVFKGINVGVAQPKVCKECGSTLLNQDEDTLDTWFSSALWTWSTLVDPKVAEDPSLTLEQILEKSPDYKRFHPTTIMETGYDILFFWVARMILMTTYATGHIPFKTVYLHGLIRTRDGKKMSKSDPKTMIDPLDMIAKYGADALRLSMIVGQSPGADSRLYEEKIAGYRNFVNKLWNASRFILMECEKAGMTPSRIDNGKWKIDGYSLGDRALLSALQVLIRDVAEGLE
ncbi:class I tRNA ligase family protein, partial [Candidatus Peregrinibacteria bacterium]|nr:class I tRNA ligase family protein [Candidatus Peregrinibacteria bacterium]